MGNIISPNKGISLPNGLAERREQERIAQLKPLAIEAEQKAREDFQKFLEEHDVFFEVHLDTRETLRGKKNIGHGLTFISRLRLPEEQQKIQ